METWRSLIQSLFGKETLLGVLRKWVFRVLSVGPIPVHVGFILDGNRRYARKHKLQEGAGYKFGFLALMCILKYCYEMGIKYVTIYAFSLDNFRRKDHEVDYLMDLMQEKIEGFIKEESIVTRYGIRVHFVGNLHRLRESVRLAAEKAMAVTAKNDNVVLFVCIAYTFTDEIAHAVREACIERSPEIQDWNSLVDNDSRRLAAENKNVKEHAIMLSDIEKHMYLSTAPDIDLLVRTSGETRLSNFLLWQTTYCHLYNPTPFWPEITFWHLVWGVLNYQQAQPYLEKIKKQM